MTGRTRATFTPEFRLEAAQLVVDQGYRAQEAADEHLTAAESLSL